MKGSFIMASCKENASSAVQKPEKSMLSHYMLFYCIFWPLRWCREKMTDCNSVKSMIILSQWVMYMKIPFRTINYERLFRYFEQPSIISQFCAQHRSMVPSVAVEVGHNLHVHPTNRDRHTESNAYESTVQHRKSVIDFIFIFINVVFFYCSYKKGTSLYKMLYRSRVSFQDYDTSQIISA